MRADILVVCDEWDAVAHDFTKFAQESGVRCERVDLDAAALRITLRYREGATKPEVAPEVSSASSEPQADSRPL